MGEQNPRASDPWIHMPDTKGDHHKPDRVGAASFHLMPGGQAHLQGMEAPGGKWRAQDHVPAPAKARGQGHTTGWVGGPPIGLFLSSSLQTSGEPIHLFPRKPTHSRVLVLTVTESHQTTEILNTNSNAPGAGAVCTTGLWGTGTRRHTIHRSPAGVNRLS